MKILAGIFVYNRPNILRHCIATVLANTIQPDEILLIDDGSDEETCRVVDEAMAGGGDHLTLIRKKRNRGAAHSGRILFAHAAMENPEYLIPIEADYIFRPDAFATVLDVFEHTEHGKMALGIAGYDHPNSYHAAVRDHVFPQGMRMQMGEDNVNRPALYRAFQSGRHTLQLASNTCPTSYLKWREILNTATEFPEMHRHLWQINDPQENPNYPDSGEYRRKQYIDDGLLSHTLSLYWNRWAIKHGVDRDKYAAWLNILPSVANSINGGGVHSSAPELSSDGWSPSWPQ